jgi:hypothetical protein
MTEVASSQDSINRPDSPTDDSSLSSKPLRIFISYKRNVAPDEEVALEIFRALKGQQYEVFIDQNRTM